MFRLVRGSDRVRRVQQRFGRDAALVQTDAAQALVALDQDDFLAEVRRVKGRGIAPRPRAHNYDFSFDGVHKAHIFTSSSLKFSKACTRSTVKRAAAAPSITRWS